MKTTDLKAVNPAAAPQARWLGSPDEHMADWENRHLSAPVFRREYDALRRAFDSMFKAGGEDNLPKPEWWDKYAPAFVWLMAHGGGEAAQPQSAGGYASHPNMPGRQKQRQKEPAGEEHQALECGMWWSSEPAVGRVADGVANRVDRLKAIGNGQVPIVAATAFRMLYKQLTGKEYKQ